jgi:hypothetical protein
MENSPSLDLARAESTMRAQGGFLDDRILDDDDIAFNLELLLRFHALIDR